MALATWWASDEVPQLPERDGFEVRIADNDVHLAQLNRIDLIEVQSRRAHGHRPYVAFLNGKIANDKFCVSRWVTLKLAPPRTKVADTQRATYPERLKGRKTGKT